jgi:hypothetical protein
VPDVIMALLSTAALSESVQTKAVLLADMQHILTQQPALKHHFANKVAVEMFCGIVPSSVHDSATCVRALCVISCIACDCAVAQEAFDSHEVYATLFSTVSQSSCTASHAEVCRAMTALLRGRGLSSSVWGDVDALSDCIRAIGNAADASSCDAAAEFVDALAAEMSQSVAEALLARGDVAGAVERMAGAASSHWCRVVLLSGVYRLILLAAGFRSSLCSDAVVQAAHAAMMNVEDDYDCGTVANTVGELVRGHGQNKAAFSCEATCKGLMRMAEAAVDRVKVCFVTICSVFCSKLCPNARPQRGGCRAAVAFALVQ